MKIVTEHPGSWPSKADRTITIRQATNEEKPGYTWGDDGLLILYGENWTTNDIAGLIREAGISCTVQPRSR